MQKGDSGKTFLGYVVHSNFPFITKLFYGITVLTVLRRFMRRRRTRHSYMGNLNANGMSSSSSSTSKNPSTPKKYYEPVETFRFLDPFPEENNNGLYLNNFYFPEEIIMMIFNYIDPKEILKVSQVCKKWCNIIKSDCFWAHKYHQEYHKKAKKLPWYVYYCLFTTDYFDANLIKNGNGQEQYKHWTIIKNYGDEFRIEDPPCGSDPLPVDVPEFNGKTSCFASSYYECNKLQEISFENNRVMQFILDKYKPHVYASEWVAGRFDCGCTYNLWCKFFRQKGEKGSKSKASKVRSRNSFDTDSEDEDVEEYIHVEHADFRVEQWMGSKWSKVEILMKDYPSGVERIVFQHEGRDTQFWKGHYGSKMAGGVLKILFDTIEPLK